MTKKKSTMPIKVATPKKKATTFLIIDNDDRVVMNSDFTMKLFDSPESSLAYVTEAICTDISKADGYRIIQVVRMYATDLVLRQIVG